MPAPPRSTKLDMVFKFKWKAAAAPTRTEFLRHLKELWDKYTAAFERDYKDKEI